MSRSHKFALFSPSSTESYEYCIETPLHGRRGQRSAQSSAITRAPTASRLLKTFPTFTCRDRPNHAKQSAKLSFKPFCNPPHVYWRLIKSSPEMVRSLARFTTTDSPQPRSCYRNKTPQRSCSLPKYQNLNEYHHRIREFHSSGRIQRWKGDSA